MEILQENYAASKPSFFLLMEPLELKGELGGLEQKILSALTKW